MADLLRNFSQNMSQRQGLLSQLGTGISQLVTQKRQSDAIKATQEQFKIASEAFNADPTGENLQVLYEVSPEMAAQYKASWDAKTELEAGYTLKRNGEILSAIELGDTPVALNHIQSYYDALSEKAKENPTDTTLAGGVESWKGLLDKAKEGDFTAVKKALMIATGVTPEGRELLTSITGLNEDYREEGKYALEIMKTGFDFEGDQASLDAAIEAAKSDPEFGKENLAALRYAKALRGGLDYKPAEFNNTLFGLADNFQKNAKRFFDERTANETLNGAIDMATSIAAGENPDPLALGQADIEAINLFQRQIDPATVREGDIALIRQAESLAEQFKTMARGWTTGAVLSAGQRAAMKVLSKKIVEAQKAKVDEVYYPASHASFKRVVNEAGRGGNIDELWKEVYSGYEPPKGGTVKTYEPVPEDMRAFFRKAAADNPSIWTKEEVDQINDPKTDISVFRDWTKTMDAYNNRNTSGVNITSTPITTKATDDDWADAKVVK